jgi:hypothetical protein
MENWVISIDLVLIQLMGYKLKKCKPCFYVGIEEASVELLPH